MPPEISGLTETRRRLIVAVIIIATMMQSLDSTIANVALPFMQGSLGASQDQISWVVTSYMVAMAIGTAICGYAAERLGRTKVFVISIAVFTLASVLCAMAQTLPEIVAFRLLQGASASAVIPLSQSLVMSIYPPEKQGSAMAIWGLGSMIAPVMGPTIGGYLTEMLNWRWVFLINIPIGIIATIGVIMLFPKSRPQPGRPFNMSGFAYLAMGAASLQLVLDRGATLDWFSSYEIIIEAVICALSFYMFIVHMLTSKRPFVDRWIFRDRNFLTGMFMSTCFQGVVLSCMVLWPNLIQTVMGYPVITTGLILMPRGIGAMIGMALVARAMRRFGMRQLIFTGFMISAVAVWLASGFNVDVSAPYMAAVGFIQGFGMGLVFVPTSTMCYMSLDRRLIDQAAPFNALVRNIGSSAGISIMVALVSHYTIVNHAVLNEAVNVFNPNIMGLVPDLTNQPQAAAALESTIGREAAMTGYCNAFVVMTYATLLLPLTLLLMHRVRKGTAVSTTQFAHEM